MGALDGLTYSNSYAYETALNWTGVLIEANPEACPRVWRNRPRARVLCSGVSKESRDILFETGTGGSGVGRAAKFGAPESMDEAWRAKEHSLSAAKKPSAVTVPTEPLGKLLRAVGVAYIDLFSLDVEGAELTALESFDWSIPVRAWVIETDVMRSSQAAQMRSLLQRHGYHAEAWAHDRRGRLKRNELWRRNSSKWEPGAYRWRQWSSLRLAE